MKPEILAQARRYYQHVLHGGTLRPEDVAFMVEALEEAANERQMRRTTRDEKIVRPGIYEVPIDEPNREWVGLSYRDVMAIFEHWDFNRDSSLVECNKLELCALFELVETKLKEKNT